MRIAIVGTQNSGKSLLIKNLFNINYEASFTSASAYCELFTIKNTTNYLLFASKT